MIRFDEGQIFIYCKSVDMRKGVDGLSMLLSERGVSAQSGGLYLFSNSSGKVVKGLIWDRNGFILIYKRLERGRFRIQFNEQIGVSAELTQEQLRWLLAGLDYEQQAVFPELKIKDFY
jgi:transposase